MMYAYNNPPSSPFDTPAAIPILVRQNTGMGVESPAQPAQPAKVLHKAFYPALVGVIALTWFFSRPSKK